MAIVTSRYLEVGAVEAVGAVEKEEHVRENPNRAGRPRRESMAGFGVRWGGGREGG